MGLTLRDIIEQEIEKAGLQLRQNEQDRPEVVKEMGRATPNALLVINIDRSQVDIIRNAVRTAINNIRDQALCLGPLSR